MCSQTVATWVYKKKIKKWKDKISIVSTDSYTGSRCLPASVRKARETALATSVGYFYWLAGCHWTLLPLPQSHDRLHDISGLISCELQCSFCLQQEIYGDFLDCCNTSGEKNQQTNKHFISGTSLNFPLAECTHRAALQFYLRPLHAWDLEQVRLKTHLSQPMDRSVIEGLPVQPWCQSAVYALFNFKCR